MTQRTILKFLRDDPRESTSPRTALVGSVTVVLLSVKQAAKLLSGSKATVYHLCSSGALRHTRIGAPGRRGVIRIPQDAIDEYLKGREVSGGVRSEKSQESPRLMPRKLRRLTLD
jgi:excisionase family DNA binding protein